MDAESVVLWMVEVWQVTDWLDVNEPVISTGIAVLFVVTISPEKLSENYMENKWKTSNNLPEAFPEKTEIAQKVHNKNFRY